MRDSTLVTLDSISGDIAKFKKQFPDAVWSVGEPPVDKFRRKAGAFQLFIATDDKIGEPSHVFRLIDGENLVAMVMAACSSIIAEVEAKKSSKPVDTNRAVR